MQEYTSKKKNQSAGTSGISLRSAAAEESIPNSVYNDVFAGKKRASAEMMGHRQDLAPSLAAKMSKAFGMDLSQVQVYRSNAMQGTGMQGMASGNKIVLSKDIDLNTTAGQTVLGHEISHVHAQSQGIGMGHSGLYRNAALEHQADAEGMMAARGQSILGESTGMDMGMGMGGIGGLSPLGPGMSASAGAPMQAWDKPWKKKAAAPVKTVVPSIIRDEAGNDVSPRREKAPKPIGQVTKPIGQVIPDDWADLQKAAEEDAWNMHGGKAKDGEKQTYRSPEDFNKNKQLINPENLQKYGKNKGRTYTNLVKLLYNHSREKAEYQALNNPTKNMDAWKQGSIYSLMDEYAHPGDEDYLHRDPLNYKAWNQANNANNHQPGNKLKELIKAHKKLQK